MSSEFMMAQSTWYRTGRVHLVHRAKTSALPRRFRLVLDMPVLLAMPSFALMGH
jgi:hypothetical protein